MTLPAEFTDEFVDLKCRDSASSIIHRLEPCTNHPYGPGRMAWVEARGSPRIMKAAAKLADASWLWTYGQHEDRTPTHAL